MAVRKTVVKPEIDLVATFVMLAEFESTQDNPTTTQEMVDEMGESETDVYNALSILADADLIDSIAGTRGLTCKWFINVPDVSVENAESIAREALATTNFGKVAEAPKPARKVAAKKTAAKPAPAKTPVIAADGTNVTIPVDFNNPDGPRRELDASKGETLIGESTYTVADMRSEDIALEKALREALPEMAAIESATWTPTFSDAKNEPYEGPESLPAVPEGVTENTWFMAHCADTESARAWWMTRAEAQMEEHKINQGEPAPF